MLSKERGKYFQEKWDEMEYKFAIIEMKQQIEQLTNNWNELEEWLKEMSMGTLEYNSYDEVLDKMKEIKENNNENK